MVYIIYIIPTYYIHYDIWKRPAESIDQSRPNPQAILKFRPFLGTMEFLECLAIKRNAARRQNGEVQHSDTQVQNGTKREPFY